MSEAKYWGEREAEEVARMEEAIEGMTPDEVYDYCRKLEDDREFAKLRYPKGRFHASMLSLDQLIDSFDDPSKIQVLADHRNVGGKVIRTDTDNAIAQALSCLSPKLRAFAEDVLNGKNRDDLGLHKNTFNWRIQQIEKIFNKKLVAPSKTVV